MLTHAHAQSTLGLLLLRCGSKNRSSLCPDLHPHVPSSLLVAMQTCSIAHHIQMNDSHGLQARFWSRLYDALIRAVQPRVVKTGVDSTAQQWQRRQIIGYSEGDGRGKAAAVSHVNMSESLNVTP